MERHAGPRTYNYTPTETPTTRNLYRYTAFRVVAMEYAAVGSRALQVRSMCLVFNKGAIARVPYTRSATRNIY